ncbi:MAG TPA: hypothetical protein VKV80_01185 [Streptosporangiaceae bacterium]|jgi:dienelactone hydrolase|nr:hypothetical protein [Streptosporangiaceae bacterium]
MSAPRPVAARLAVAALALAALACGCASTVRQQPAARQQAARPASPRAPARTASSPPPPAAPADAGSLGSYQVGERQFTFAEPAHTGPTGAYLDERTLATQVWYPLAASSASRPARGAFPLLLFAPGFRQCAGGYSDLLRAWASAGYVVAAVNFPRTNCHLGAAAYEPDLVNQPGDVSYVLSRLLALDAQPGGLLSGLLDRREIGAAGQSDGGDTVAALAANTCCADGRLRAVAVLSGAEWPPMPGRYFAGAAPPMLFAQGSADTINPPWTSLQLYTADGAGARYYLDLFGASHMVPYVGTNPVEQVVARVTVDFFDRYLLGRPGALAAMARDGNVAGTAALVSGGRLPP